MSPSDDKQNRLSTLSQDVIAVTKKPGATGTVPAVKPQGRSIPAAQDVFNVSSVPPVTQSVPATARPPVSDTMSMEMPRPTPAVVWVAVLLALVSVAVALYAAHIATGKSAPVAVADPQVAKLEAELRLANDRVQKLEEKLQGAAADSKQLEGAGTAAGLLQINATLRSLRNDIDQLVNDQARLTAQVAAAVKESKAANTQAEQALARVGSVESAPKAAPAPAVSSETQAQLKALSQKTDKMANDIRQLYRVLESQ